LECINNIGIIKSEIEVGVKNRDTPKYENHLINIILIEEYNPGKIGATGGWG